MFDLEIDKNKNNKKIVFNEKSCEKKQQQHTLKIFYMWMFCITVKRKKYKTVCAELTFAKSPSTEWS